MTRLYLPLLLIVLVHSSVWADDLLTLKDPTKIVISNSTSELKIELPSINSTCSYGFLEEGLRGIIDCPGQFPSFSKTVPLKSNNFVKQIRIGIHKDKLRVVLDLFVALPSSLNTVTTKNVFKFTTVADTQAVGQPPAKPLLLGRSIEPSPTPPSLPTEIPVVETPTVTPTQIVEPTTTPTANVTAIVTATPSLTATATPTPEPTTIATLAPTPAPSPIIVPTEIPALSPTGDTGAVKETSEELPLGLETLQVNFNEGDRLIKDVVVTNNSSTLRSVTVDSYLDLDGGVKADEGLSDDEPVGNLTPSPRKFTLGNGQKRSIRFILALKNSVTKSDHEISFVARLSDPDGELLAPKIAFTYVPKQLLPKLVSTPLDGKLRLTNTGNARIELSSGKCCRLDDCQGVNITHLAAGRSVVLDVPEDCQLEFVREFKGSFQKFKVGREIINDSSL